MTSFPSLTAAALLAGAASLHAAGFTEPPVIFYGQINQTANGYTIPVTAGTLSWTVQSTAAGATPVVATTAPGLAAGQSFYRLEIPVEKLPPTGFTLSPNTISTAVASFSRGTITVGGAPVSIVYPTGTDRATFSYGETLRGKMDRVDLSLTTPFLDTDGDGLPDWWEDKYGLDKYDPSDATGQDTHGRTWLDDYNNHVDPTSQLTEYAMWTAARSLPPPVSDPAADPDHDGLSNLLEFALDTNPNTADSAAAGAKSLTQVETVDGKRYLTLTVQKPGRASVTYIVEKSTDLKTWKSVEGTDVQTLVSNATTLKVRSVGALDTPGAPPAYLRLRVVLAP